MWIYILALSVVEIGVVLNFFDAGNDFVQFGDGRHLFCVSLVQIALPVAFVSPLFAFCVAGQVKTEMSTYPPIC